MKKGTTFNGKGTVIFTHDEGIVCLTNEKNAMGWRYSELRLVNGEMMEKSMFIELMVVNVYKQIIEQAKREGQALSVHCPWGERILLDANQVNLVYESMILD
jgi:hypothetical protein